MMLRNDFAFFEVSGGAAALGSPVVPINWHLKAEEVAYILADSGAEILVCHADLLPQIRDGLPGHIKLLVVTTPPEIAGAFNVAGRADAGARRHDRLGPLARHARAVAGSRRSAARRCSIRRARPACPRACAASR